jgi:sialidase-1
VTAQALRRITSLLIAAGLALTGVVALGPAAAQAAKTPGSICSSTPFKADPKRKVWYRIPSVVKTGRGTLVAFAERRDKELGDDGNFDVVTVRSTTNGCSWSRPLTVGNDGTSRVSNPVPIVDAVTGKILLFSVVSPRPGSTGTGKGLYLQTSSNDGRSFTPLLADQIHPAGFKGGLTGPGHGIQLTVKHQGRLLLPMGYKTRSGMYGAYGIYSDDHGRTWKVGYDQQDRTGRYDLMEGTVAELPNGKLFITYRLRIDKAPAGTARRYAISSDGGKSLSQQFSRLKLNVVSVQGSALTLKGRKELLFSSPADPTRHLRRDMSIFVSTTGGRSWGRRYQVELESTPGSYSDLVQLSSTSVGVMYETGRKKWKERIAFESVKIPALTAARKVAPTVRVSRAAKVAAGRRAAVHVKVSVRGIRSTPGRITVKYAGAGHRGSRSVKFTYSMRGARTITLPKLRKGRYRLVVLYSGYGRIKAAVRSGTLRVV